MYNFKGSVTCANERKEFSICRATPAGKLGEPERCEGKAANFLQCYHDMIKASTANCQKQFADTMTCMTKNLDNKDCEGICGGLLQDFATCK